MSNIKVNHDRSAFELFGGDVRVWIEQEAIHMKAHDRRSHDPVELTETMAREVAAVLLELAARLDD
jgi:predicted metal-dependent hydrolase